MDLDVEKQLADLRRQVADLKPRENPISWIERFQKFREFCAVNQARAALQQQRPAPRRTTHVYMEIGPGHGVRRALMGFDFASEQEKNRVLTEYRFFLKTLQLDDGEVGTIEHSWELVTHRHGSPDPDHPCAYLETGRNFLNGRAWRGALDVREGSIGLKIYDKHTELKRYSAENPAPGKWKAIDYRSLWRSE